MFGGNTTVARVPILVGVDDLNVAIDVGRYAFNQRNLILDGDGVGVYQGFGSMRAGAHAVDGAAAGLNPHEIVAEIVELLLDAGLPCFADGHDANHRGDADGDAEHRQDTSP